MVTGRVPRHPPPGLGGAPGRLAWPIPQELWVLLWVLHFWADGTPSWLFGFGGRIPKGRGRLGAVNPYVLSGLAPGIRPVPLGIQFLERPFPPWVTFFNNTQSNTQSPCGIGQAPSPSPCGIGQAPCPPGGGGRSQRAPDPWPALRRRPPCRKFNWRKDCRRLLRTGKKNSELNQIADKLLRDP